MAKGYHQRQGVDYDKTFSQVAMIKSIKTVLAIAAHYDYEFRQMDVKIVFLNGNLEEEVYMIQPEGYWWRTTPVATKTRYHGAEGAFCARGCIRLSLFLYFELLTRTCLSGSSLISLSLLGFWVGSSLFGIPFVKPIFLCEPYFFL